jgi:hypothetical protein
MLNFHINPAEALAKDRVRETQVLAQQASSENLKLKDEIHHLAIIVEAMWELLKSKTGTSDEDLRKQIVEVEFEKAKAHTSMTVKCKSCARPVSLKTKTCLFCGEKVETKEIFPL